MTAAPAPGGNPRAMWIGFALVTGVLVGVTAGLLSAGGGIPIPLAIVAGGGAVILFITLVRYAAGDGS